MKIAIIGNNSCGMYDFRHELIEKLIEQNNSVTILTPFDKKTDELIKLDVGLVNTPLNRRGINLKEDFCLLNLYKKLLRQICPDLVITYTIKPNVYGGLICRFLKIPYAVNITGLGTTFQGSGLLRKFVVLLYKLSLKKAKTVFFENSENMQIFLDEKICNKNQVCLLNGAGVNLEHYSPQEYPTDNSQIRFLFIGRVMQEKGIDELFAAMQKLHDDGFDCSLDVVGGFEEDYKERIDTYTQQGWLAYHGYQEDVRPFIENCHCFVLPSYHEGMANTNLECAASARPVITSNIHGCKEAVIDSVSGYLCEKQDVQSLYNAMCRFVKLSYEEKKQMGLCGRKHMKENFDKRKVVEMTIKNL